MKEKDANTKLNSSLGSHQHGGLVEEIEGLIRVYKDGHVERSIVPHVSTLFAPEVNLTSKDIVIDRLTKIWARFYVPKCQGTFPLLMYFHGGGFCVGSVAWSCYHEFLTKLATSSNCVIMSVNYRLAPENPLPAAYDDAFKALMWVKTQVLDNNGPKRSFWSKKCNFSSIFLGGDSAGANIAHHLSIRLGNSSKSIDLKPLNIKGSILIQPFFGGEARTYSEKYIIPPPRSALSLTTSDTYWRVSLPLGANRDHPWCNPLAKGLNKLESIKVFDQVMVCIAEMDILKDRNMEFCDALAKEGKRVDCMVYKGVGHAFQILNRSQQSQTQTLNMIAHINGFINSS